MNKLKWFVPLLAVAAASATVFLTSGCRGQDSQTNNTPPVVTTNNVSVFTCPMHPEVVSNVPGDCLKCGMHLVPKP